MAVSGERPNLKLPSPLATTAIGSLPHTQLEMAMQLAFSVEIPYLPTLPRKEPAEFMIPQAIEGLPGASFDQEGEARIVRSRWQLESKAFGLKLERALETMALEEFEPSATFAGAWKPFLWEIEHRGSAFAKAQITGPVTARWVLRLDDGSPLSSVPELERQLFRLQLARGLAMVRAIRERGARPILFLDEPGLYALDPRDPSSMLVLQELKILVLALQKEGALVGIHCCSNTDWTRVLGLGLDIVSLDARLSLGAVLANAEVFSRYLDAGGLIALGVIPTNVASHYEVEGLVDAALAMMRSHGDSQLVGRILSQSLLTPACGLAMRTVPDTEEVFADLRHAQRLLQDAARNAAH